MVSFPDYSLYCTVRSILPQNKRRWLTHLFTESTVEQQLGEASEYSWWANETIFSSKHKEKLSKN